MKNVIKSVKEQEEPVYKLAIAVGYIKGYKESGNKKKFTVEEVLELLECIRSSGK